MPLVPASALSRAADQGGCAVGAFNCCNMEPVGAAISAALAEKRPPSSFRPATERPIRPGETGPSKV